MVNTPPKTPFTVHLLPKQPEPQTRWFCATLLLHLPTPATNLLLSTSHTYPTSPFNAIHTTFLSKHSTLTSVFIIHPNLTQKLQKAISPCPLHLYKYTRSINCPQTASSNQNDFWRQKCIQRLGSITCIQWSRLMMGIYEWSPRSSKGIKERLEAVEYLPWP